MCLGNVNTKNWSVSEVLVGSRARASSATKSGDVNVLMWILLFVLHSNMYIISYLLSFVVPIENT